MNTEEKIRQMQLVERVKKVVGYPYVRNVLKHLPDYADKESSLYNFFANRNKSEEIYNDLEALAIRLEKDN